MSNRLRSIRRSRPRYDPDADYYCRFAATRTTREDDIEEAKKATHDAVIEDLGDTRSGGVVWLIRKGDERFTTLDEIDDVQGPQGDLRAFMRRFPLGALVIAMAPARKSAPSSNHAPEGGE